MDIKSGSLVRSTAGHDKGDLLLVVGFEKDAVLVADGRQRPLEKPKKKNPKHLEPTSLKISDEETQFNSRLRKALFKLKSEQQNQGG